MSKQRSLKPKVDANLSTEESALTSCVPKGTDPETLPFLEFSDQDINAEKWDCSPLVKDKSIINIQAQFEDPHKIHLPLGFAVDKWKKLADLFDNANFVIFSLTSEYPDLITPNLHLLNVEFYRTFISIIEILLYIGCTKPFPLEYGNPAISSAGDRPWRPWHHIYSNCKISKGEHTPTYNPSGKYVVRLFWLGAWRKIYVDDLVPVDFSNAILIPSLHMPSHTHLEQNSETIQFQEKQHKGKSKDVLGKKETIEMWPIILCKALLKIASLSSCDMEDFDIIHCLTGWVPQIIKIKDTPLGELWDIFMGFVDRFEWEEEKKAGSSRRKSRGKNIPEAPKKASKVLLPAGIENMGDGQPFVILSCKTFRPIEEHGDSSQHEILTMFLSQIRDIPLIQPPPRPELQFWKTFRYEKWAVEQGIISPEIEKLNIKSLKIIDPFSRILQYETSDNHLTLDTDKKSEASSKRTKGGKSTVLEPDPSMWVNFSDLHDKLNYFTIYFQPRAFKSKTEITDINFTNQKNNFNDVVYPFNFKGIKSEPIYMFTDSIDYKFVVITLAQVGDTGMLQKNIKAVEEEYFETPVDLDLCTEIILRKTRKKKFCIEPQPEVPKPSTECKIEKQPISLVLEEYFWDSNALGEPRGLISTFGTKSLTLDMKPGRISYRIWISTHCSYVLQVFSDTPVTVGYLEKYLTACSAESQLATNVCNELSSCYGKLVQSFGTPEHSINLRNFYQCYKPTQHNLSKKELAIIHRIYFKVFYKMICENTQIAETPAAIKLLFLQLKTFDYINPYMEEPHLYPDSFSSVEEVEYAKIMQRAAVKIQAFFKRIYIRSLLSKMHVNHKQFLTLFDVLKKVYTNTSVTRLNYALDGLRRFYEQEEMKILKNKFDLFHDLKSVLKLHVYTGTQTAPELTWVPLTRYEFYVNSKKPIFIKISLFCSLHKYSLKVFDNDNLREMKPEVNISIVEEYPNNTNGYTILCYGWSDVVSKINWKLILAYTKTSEEDMIHISDTLLTKLTLKDQYMPNFENIICRQIVQVGSDSMLTANLTTSFDQVTVCLRLLNNKNKLVREATGVKSVLLPLLDLRCSESSKSEDSLNLIHGIHGFAHQKGKSLALTVNSETNSNKSSKKHVDPQDGRSSRSIRSSESISKTVSIGDTSSATGSRRHHKKEKKTVTDSFDANDEISYMSQHDPDSKQHGKRGQSKTEARFSLSNKSRTSNRSGISSNDNKVVETTRNNYILEAKVIGGSWPLTAEEWSRVQKIREQNYLNLLEERRSSIKKAVMPKMSQSALEDPYWTLDLVYYLGDSFEFKQDNSVTENIKQVKSKWFKDIERYKRGIALREAFIQEHTILRSGTIIDRNSRSNDSKEFATNIIKDEPLEQYMIKPLQEVDEDCCKTKCETDYIIEEANIEHEIKESKDDEIATQEVIETQLQEQKDNFDLLNKWFEEIRSDSEDMVTEALAMEREYVEKIGPLTKSKGDKQGKVKKKK